MFLILIRLKLVSEHRPGARSQDWPALWRKRRGAKEKEGKDKETCASVILHWGVEPYLHGRNHSKHFLCRPAGDHFCLSLVFLKKNNPTSYESLMDFWVEEWIIYTLFIEQQRNTTCSSYYLPLISVNPISVFLRRRVSRQWPCDEEFGGLLG